MANITLNVCHNLKHNSKIILSMFNSPQEITNYSVLIKLLYKNNTLHYLYYVVHKS